MKNETRFLNWLKKNFVTGISVLAPILGTALLLGWIFVKITEFGYNSLVPKLYSLFFPDLTAEEVYEKIFGTVGARIILRAFVAFVMIVFVIFVGWLTGNFFGRKLIRLGEKILERIPFVGRMYAAIKQIVTTLLGRNRPIFDRVVLIEFPRKESYSIGFVTAESAGEIDQKTPEELLHIFIPTTPNPTSGYLLMVPTKDVRVLDMSVEDGLKLVISGGTVIPEMAASAQLKPAAPEAETPRE
ncbi:MAG: DUF502 domain-containing protein [Thermoplasmata archaeon]|nr:DUF502 domain-containing protein [Thermoplasmata archaeon]